MTKFWIIWFLFFVPSVVYVAYLLGVMRGRARQMALYKKVPCLICEQRGKFAWYTVRAHSFLSKLSNSPITKQFSKIPIVGKWVMWAVRMPLAFLVAFWYQQTIREGKQYASSHTKTEMSRV